MANDKMSKHKNLAFCFQKKPNKTIDYIGTDQSIRILIFKDSRWVKVVHKTAILQSGKEYVRTEEIK